MVFKDRESACGVTRIDFGALTRDIILKDKYCFEGTRSETYLSSPSCERKETVSLASKDGYL